MRLDLTDEETAVLIRELADITFTAHYQLSLRIKTLSAILAKLRQVPAREPEPESKRYEPPRATLSRRRHRRAWTWGRIGTRDRLAAL